MAAFEDLIANGNSGLHADQQLLNSPVFEALFDCNIVWKSKDSLKV
jgi:hypothetical protein